jgi:hypothetical protein
VSQQEFEVFAKNSPNVNTEVCVERISSKADMGDEIFSKAILDLYGEDTK